MHRIAGVIPLRGVSEIDRAFDYLADCFPALCPGDIVTIPFGRSSSPLLGVVIEVRQETPQRQLKSISDVVDARYRLSSEMLGLAFFMQRQFFCTLADAFRCMLPSGLRLRLKECWLGDNEALLLQRIGSRDEQGPFVWVSVEGQKIKCPYRLAEQLLTEGILRKELVCDCRINEKRIQRYRLAESTHPLPPLPSRGKDRYEKILSFLRHRKADATFLELHEALGISKSPLETLVAKGYVEKQTVQTFRSPYALMDDDHTDIVLNEEQDAAYQEMLAGTRSGQASAYLLHGVTGSGKTKVLLKTIDQVLRDGKSVIYLVPEISLTSQTYVQLSQRYASRVVVIHSGLSEGERTDAWLQIQNGTKSVVLGTRSAVFAPCVHLGAIILDEEHDSSYKSDVSPRYHARDIARFRCAKNSATMILSSATPDVESYYKAENQIYRLLTMKKRFRDTPLPRVRIEDLRPELRDAPDELLGSQLKSQIESNLSRGEQTILFVDRRGYQRFASCVNCGYVPVCPNCSVSLTLHADRTKRIVCHYCGYTAPALKECPSCGGGHILYHGYGSQKVEEQLRHEFPHARILRMDADAVKGKLSHERILTAFRNHEADILLGTQMVAKGHDFPKVSLVGVIMADKSLYMSDYRAYEHSFSLLTQVIGRAGRSSTEGRAFIQTLNPHHELLALCQSQDYEAFYRSEINLRKALIYPPFCNLCVFGFASRNEEQLNQALTAFSSSLEVCITNTPSLKLIVYGPFEAPVYKVKNLYRKRFIIKYKPGQDVLNCFHQLASEYSASYRGRVAVHVDINPALV